MTRRALQLGLFLILLIGWASPAAVAPKRPGLSATVGNRSVRVSVQPRHRTRASYPTPGLLALSRSISSDGLGYLSAASAILVDAVTGEVLFEQRPDEPRPPASITKILTALVILERGHLTDTVLVSRAAASVGGYRLGLRRGQRISLQDLLAAILIRSANDAAVAAAEHVGKGLAGFAALMNARAYEIGMYHSQFENPHGLDEPGHVTTARDMVLLTRVAMEHPVFAQLVRTRDRTVTVWRQGRRGLVPQTRTIVSHNKLLGWLEGADGVKTGYTDAAGRCLVASASRGGRRMIAVLLNDPQRWMDAAALLEFGFGAGRGTAGSPGSPWLEAVVGGSRG